MDVALWMGFEIIYSREMGFYLLRNDFLGVHVSEILRQQIVLIDSIPGLPQAVLKKPASLSLILSQPGQSVNERSQGGSAAQTLQCGGFSGPPWQCPGTSKATPCTSWGAMWHWGLGQSQRHARHMPYLTPVLTFWSPKTNFNIFIL